VASYCIFDTEYTTWEGAQATRWNGRGQHREVFQIAAVRVEDGKAWKDLKTLSLLVRPQLNPVLSAYATELTGISQEMLERDGIETPEALARFADFTGDLCLFSNSMDLHILAETCGLQKVVMPLEPHRYLSLHYPLYAALDKHFSFPHAEYPSGRLHELAGLTPPSHLGGVHNALHDVWSIYATCEWLKQQGTDVIGDLLKA
jgi:Exonuclease